MSSVSSRLVHVMTGHGWFGEYKAKMLFIRGDPQCTCGEPVQSVPHLLFLCPPSENNRSYLTEVSPDLNPATLFGSLEGLKAVSKFIYHTGIGLYL
ncbi:hypothetical protein BN14_03708 [Rhizoctonia solani AG-1 IB]|uniref:Reverse transcriptase zinc-binding domain-containing protein n=1 Tax=Thanatephorus cucumeris (strain AG1-IB / isolate 7/3/14) TaxID=1108050 RepID=M5BT93_THACB|nr:hypothetical protein BN14_03708 [Rhizoctonia solani AG-1 IB]